MNDVSEAHIRKAGVMAAISEAIATVEDATDAEVTSALGDLTRYWASKMFREQVYTPKEQDNGTSSNEGDSQEGHAGEEGDSEEDHAGEEGFRLPQGDEALRYLGVQVDVRKEGRSIYEGER